MFSVTLFVVTITALLLAQGRSEHPDDDKQVNLWAAITVSEPIFQE